MLTRIKVDVHINMELETMINNRKYESANNIQDRYIYFYSQRKLRNPTQEVIWKDGTACCIPLEDMK